MPGNKAQGQIFIPRSPEDVLPRKPEDIIPAIPQGQESALPNSPRGPRIPNILDDIIIETDPIGCDSHEVCPDWDPTLLEVIGGTALDAAESAAESVGERYEIRYEEETPILELESDHDDEPLPPPNLDEEAGSGDSYIFYPEF